MKKVVGVIGGGISGTLTLINILKIANNATDIFWFDAEGLFFKGFAYATNQKCHLLNVRAANMSAFADEPAHFTNWLKNSGKHYTENDFVPRFLYAQYVQHIFNYLRHGNTKINIVLITGYVTEIKTTDNLFVVKCGANYTVNKIVLATGNFLPSHPRSHSEDFTSNKNYFRYSFRQEALKAALSKNVITILGAGLTMIDMVLSLQTHNFKGHINIISPHGYLPQAHDEISSKLTIDFLDAEKSYSLQELYKLINQKLKSALKNNLPVHPVIDGLRPHLQLLWMNFSIGDKKMFLRHLRHKWGVARHRAPKQSMEIISQLISQKKLSVITGRIFNVEEKNNSLHISYTHAGEKKTIISDIILNCTGPESDFNNVNSPLIQQLIKDHLIVPHPLKYGIVATRSGLVSANIYTLGPPLKGMLWESTAVPEIRLQAQSIASQIILD